MVHTFRSNYAFTTSSTPFIGFSEPLRFGGIPFRRMPIHGFGAPFRRSLVTSTPTSHPQMGGKLGQRRRSEGNALPSRNPHTGLGVGAIERAEKALSR